MIFAVSLSCLVLFISLVEMSWTGLEYMKSCLGPHCTRHATYIVVELPSFGRFLLKLAAHDRVHP